VDRTGPGRRVSGSAVANRTFAEAAGGGAIVSEEIDDKAGADGDAVLAAIGARIRQIRLDSKRTQRDVAESMGVNQTFIALAEAGTQNLSIKSLLRIATALSVPLEDLLPVSSSSKATEWSIARLNETLARVEPNLTLIADQVRTAMAILDDVRLMCQALGVAGPPAYRKQSDGEAAGQGD